MKRLIALRRRHKAFGRGTLEFLHPANPKVLAFLRRYTPHPQPPSADGHAERDGHPHGAGGKGEGEEIILVVANLSRFVQHAELDLSAFQGLGPGGLFSRHPCPPAGKQPYSLTFGPHAFYWFSLERQHVREQVHRAVPHPGTVATLTVRNSWEELFQESGRDRLEEVLPDCFNQRLWTGNRSHVV